MTLLCPTRLKVMYQQLTGVIECVVSRVLNTRSYQHITRDNKSCVVFHPLLFAGTLRIHSSLYSSQPIDCSLHYRSISLPFHLNSILDISGPFKTAGYMFHLTCFLIIWKLLLAYATHLTMCTDVHRYLGLTRCAWYIVHASLYNMFADCVLTATQRNTSVGEFGHRFLCVVRCQSVFCQCR